MEERERKLQEQIEKKKRDLQEKQRAKQME